MVGAGECTKYTDTNEPHTLSVTAQLSINLLPFLCKLPKKKAEKDIRDGPNLKIDFEA